MQITGTIEEIVFRNNENGYTIAKVNTKDGEITATGKFPIIGNGEQVIIEGENMVHPKYGFQFKASYIKVYRPTTNEQIVKYLSSGLISGVGPVTATSIVSMFGEKTLDIIESDPEELSKVKGVSIKKARQISLTYNDIKRMQEAVMFLQQYDISINLAVKIYDKYKNKTESKLTKNPYIMVEDIDGVGFKTADRIAEKMGIDKDSEFRMRAGIIHMLKSYSEKNGSTIILQEKLIELTAELLGIDMEIKRDGFDQIIVNLIIGGQIKEYVDDEKNIFLALADNYNMERLIASKLVLICNSWQRSKKDLSVNIESYEKKIGFKLDENQKIAIDCGVNNGVSIITGGPGTGKTTIINGINSILKSFGLKTILLAPTGRAAKRLSESTGDEAMTIHRALDLNYKGVEFKNLFSNGGSLEKDVYIVDEASMIDVYVMSNLIKAIPTGSQLIIVGDKDQLPSVGAGNVLDDIIKSGLVPVIYLSQIFRQSGESKIITNAHKINNGEIPNFTEKNKDFFFINNMEQKRASDEIVDLVSTRLTKYLNITTDKIQVITPTKLGECGSINLNQKLQDKINPASETKNETTIGAIKFRVGDRVMQTVNNYDQEWTNGKIIGKGVFNGDMGEVSEINPISGEVIVLFEDGKYAMYSIAELDQLTLSYAITIHKSQGSEFDAVVIPILGGNPMLYSRNLLYTAVTRAKKLVVIIGNQLATINMIKNNYSNKRNTLLKKFIFEEEEKYKKLFL